METIKEIYKIGCGPSSSHTMGPQNAALQFKKKYLQADNYKVTLYGSLASTGKGHLTEVALENVLKTLQIIWEPKIFLPFHPNGMFFEAFYQKEKLGEWQVFSVGGGSLAEEGKILQEKEIYPKFTLQKIINHCLNEGITFWEFVESYEGKEIWDYLKIVWETMKQAIKNGLENDGVLPGEMKFRRKAGNYRQKALGYKGALQRKCLLYSYALAVSEENASSGKIVTAPTCGSCGVLPAVLYLLHKYNDFSDEKILKALATAGIIGNLVKYNASISGAEVGCQGEVGTACSMAAAAAAQLFGAGLNQIEYAAEMGMEHHLGLTCDPVYGLVQVPCIERNAFAAARALDCTTFALLSDGYHRISFDEVVETMRITGLDLSSKYKETSLGGLADLKRKK